MKKDLVKGETLAGRLDLMTIAKSLKLAYRFNVL